MSYNITSSATWKWRSYQDVVSRKICFFDPNSSSYCSFHVDNSSNRRFILHIGRIALTLGYVHAYIETVPKKMRLDSKSQFLSNLANTWPILHTIELVIFTKFHENCSKIEDFLLMRHFLPVSFFCDSLFVQ